MEFSTSTGFANIINGKKVTSPATQGVVNPSTEEVFAHVPIATREQLDEAIGAAEQAFPAWAAKPFDERRKALHKIIDLVDQHLEELTELLMREVGKDQMSASFEMSHTLPWLRAHAEHRLDDEIVFEDETKVIKNRFRPYGVCGAIIPFNFPVLLAAIKVSQALLAGNCIIVKSPPTSPCSTMKFIELVQTAVPPGVASVLNGGNDLGEWIAAHPRIMRVSMTGSTVAGKAVMRGVSSELKSLTLELGGNDPAIILDDVNPKEIAQRILMGITANAGQICFTMKRIYIHDKIYDAVRNELVELAKSSVKIGNPFDTGVTMGPVHNKGQYNRLCGFLEDCQSKGYKIAFQSEKPTSGKGYFIPLTIVDNPPEDSRLVREEQFGPIAPLLRWSDDDEVIRRANDTEYGLASSVWGKDLNRAQRIADGLYNGIVWINDWGVVGGELPLTGVKHSGVGVESSRHGLTSWTYVQSLVCNKTL